MEPIEILRLLAHVERERQHHRQVIERIPREIESLERQFAEERTILESARAEMKALVRRRKELEDGIQDLLAQKKRFEAQLPMIKNNEEYRAALSQIDFIQKKISKNEDAILLTFEEEDGVGDRISKAEAVFSRTEARLNERRSALVSELEHAKAESEQLDTRCAELVASLAPDLARRYMQVSGSKEMPVVPVTSASCGGCFNALTPQILNELRDGRRYRVCDNCGRIVIWEEGTST